MAAIKLLEKHEVDNEAATILEMVERDYGLVPNILKAIANCPELLTSFVPFWAKLYISPSVGPRYRALAALGTAKAHDCKYCVSHMSASALKVGLTQLEINAIGLPSSNEILNEKEQLIVEYAFVLTKDSGGVTDELLGKLKENFNDAELVNLTLLIGLYNLTGRFLKALRIDIEETMTIESGIESFTSV
ncbi:carboxymuconolactone decarboxylase family protein [Plectonema radiosum NIES-515]|uniref:Carboxymuconolactone decarboxylase family protein n=1 Tax=Plectonema radiosum NIES-515 TaxID=2986073 RepID=A0ABT3B5D9_9CYAN|nr:carboxymuconolactone decarboxylase family protein [Plectonema radiosum]MCV3216581.1 carboxymuconolactone decarboxylase family protein [Plectonema radiosum NIES-515]